MAGGCGRWVEGIHEEAKEEEGVKEKEVNGEGFNQTEFRQLSTEIYSEQSLKEHLKLMSNTFTCSKPLKFGLKV